MPPMCETMVLKPLAKEDIDKKELEEIKTNSALVVDKLAGMKYGSTKNYQQFLEEMHLADDQYIKAFLKERHLKYVLIITILTFWKLGEQTWIYSMY